MKVFVTGVCGQLGYDVMNELNRRGHEGVGSDVSPAYSGMQNGSAISAMRYVSLDITDAKAVHDTIAQIQPDAVIHCAGWTAVDAAEEEDKQDLVWNINVNGTKYIADACKKWNSKMVYLSTDYVFSGIGEAPWKPDCKEYAAQNFYGRSKLHGEWTVCETLDQFFVVRTAWVFGLNGMNFVKTMLELGKKYDTLRVVCDQIGTPTYTKDLARLLVDIVQTEKYGYYHATNEGGYISWYDFACEIFRQAEMETRVVPVTTAEYGQSRAARPLNSRLDKSKLTDCGFVPLPDWRDALSRYLAEMGQQKNECGKGMEIR